MAKIDLSRAWITTSVALAVIGIGTHFWLRSMQTTAETDVKRALEALKNVATASGDIQILEREKKEDQFRAAGPSRQGAYFEKQAQTAGLDLPPNLGKPRDESPKSAQGFVDTGYELTWVKRPGEAPGFSRRVIAQLLHNIEKNSALLKVSEITLDAANTRDIEADLWIPKIWVTERRPRTSTTP